MINDQGQILNQARNQGGDQAGNQARNQAGEQGRGQLTSSQVAGRGSSMGGNRDRFVNQYPPKFNCTS